MKPVSLPAVPLKPQLLLLAVSVCTCLAVGLAVWMNMLVLALVPLALAMAAAILYDYRVAYYLLIFCIPFSVEVAVPGGLRTDLPSEPLMILLLACFILTAFTNRLLSASFYRHPIVILIGLALLWSVVSAFSSVDTTKSVKYILAKLWYVVAFLFVTGSLFRSTRDAKLIIWTFLAPLTLLVAMAIVRHAAIHFSFEDVNSTVVPFFKNHVIYAATVALFLPFTWWVWQQQPAASVRRYLLLGILGLMVFGVIISYTRASWLAIPLALGYAMILRYNLTKWVLGFTVAGLIAGALYFTHQNNYQLYAPDFEKTIYNEGNIGKHLEATYKLQDVSGMERVYRWIGAIRMAYEHPLTGTGPSTFYPEYKKYTISSFRTYVSDNPEKSTAHNYFLLTVAEQGVVGLILYVALCFYALLLGQRLYRTLPDKALRQLAMAATLCLVIILFHLLLNELIEVDKIGSMFYISLALLLKLDLWQRAQVSSLKAAGE